MDSYSFLNFDCLGFLSIILVMEIYHGDNLVAKPIMRYFALALPVNWG